MGKNGQLPIPVAKLRFALLLISLALILPASAVEAVGGTPGNIETCLPLGILCVSCDVPSSNDMPVWTPQSGIGVGIAPYPGHDGWSPVIGVYLIC